MDREYSEAAARELTGWLVVRPDRRHLWPLAVLAPAAVLLAPSSLAPDVNHWLLLLLIAGMALFSIGAFFGLPWLLGVAQTIAVWDLQRRWATSMGMLLRKLHRLGGPVLRIHVLALVLLFPVTAEAFCLTLIAGRVMLWLSVPLPEPVWLLAPAFALCLLAHMGAHRVWKRSEAGAAT